MNQQSRLKHRSIKQQTTKTCSCGLWTTFIVTSINIGLFIYIYIKTDGKFYMVVNSMKDQIRNSQGPLTVDTLISKPLADILLPVQSTTNHVIGSENLHQIPIPTSSEDFSSQKPQEIDCLDPLWCNIPMPTVSHFKFPPPTDPQRWRRAQAMAASKDQILLREVIKVFPNAFDFLDGDRIFRKLHSLIDVFLDSKHGFEPLTADYSFAGNEERRMLLAASTATSDTGDSEDEAERPPDKSTYILDGKQVVPEPYNYRYNLRAPILQIGYEAFQKDTNTYFSGNFLGGNFISRTEFLQKWKKSKDEILHPFISVCVLNENWGMLSTMFPNRTAKWGQCCNKPQDRLLMDFLDHEKTLMLAIGQHSNVTHPKVIMVPRGLPLQWAQTHHMIWDAMRYSLKNIKKNKLLFVSTSSWGPRPQIIRCVSNKFSPDDFEGHSDTPKTEMSKTKSDRKRYYEKLSSSIFGLSLPGLGYDCFRMWELLTMGSIVIVEKNVGLDRTLWRLPAILVEDFDEVTPEMLHTAYIEAIYRAKDFEYFRLTQSWWWNVFSNVSLSMTTKPLLDAFPMEAVDLNFARPREPYACGKTDTCGPGTKRTPKRSC